MTDKQYSEIEIVYRLYHLYENKNFPIESILYWEKILFNQYSRHFESYTDEEIKDMLIDFELLV